MNRDIAQLQNKLQYVKDKLTKGNIQTDDALIDKNTELKEENKKLWAIVKDMKQKMKYSSSRENTNASMNMGYDRSAEYEKIIEKMKDQIKKNKETLDNLKLENELLRRGKGAEASDRALLDKISAKEREVIDMRNRME